MDFTDYSLISFLTCWNVIVLLVTIAVCIFSALCIYIYSIHRKYDHLPGPPREGFFSGNINELIRERKKNKLFFQQILLKWAQKYGNTFRLSFFHVPFVATSDPDAVKDLLVTGHHPKAKIAYVPFTSLWGQRFLGKGLVTETDHKTWAFRRALMNPCFKKGYLRNLTKEFNTGADILVTKLAETADGDTKIRLLDKFHNATLDILAKIAFGIEVNSLEKENTEFTKAVCTVLKGLSAALSSGFFFTLNPFNWKLMLDTRKAIKFLRDFGKKTLQERTDAKNRGDYVPDDILTHIIKMKEENPDMDTEVILDDFVTFFIAGQETTANLLGSVMELLGRNKNVLQRLKEEVDDTVGEKPVIEYNDLDRLIYLDMVVKETLRLASPASLSFRQLSKDKEIGGYRVPKGTNVIMSSYVSGRLPEFFDNPEKFDPERFAPNLENRLENRYNTYTYFPFTLGPRTCIGKHFADMEAKIILTKLIQRFEFDLDTSQTFELEEITTIRPKGGALCTISLRGNEQKPVFRDLIEQK